MELRKRLYETTFIVNASLEDSQIEGAIGHVQEIITRNGGEITAVNRWGRKRLAYTIQKKNNGFYANVEFVGTEPVIAQLQRTYLLDQNFLRFLTIQIDPRLLQAREKALATAAAAGAPVPGMPGAPLAGMPGAPLAAAGAPAGTAPPAPAGAPVAPGMPGAPLSAAGMTAAAAVPPASAEPAKKPLFDDEPGTGRAPNAGPNA